MCNHMDNFVDFETIKRTDKNSTVSNWIKYQYTDTLTGILAFGSTAIVFTAMIVLGF